MKILAVLAVVCMTAALMSCQLGVSEDDVESIVATAVVESEKRMDEEARAIATGAVADALVGSEERMKRALETAIADSELRVTEVLEDSAAETVKAVCASDYVTKVNYTTGHWIVSYLQGDDITPEDLSLAYERGFALDEKYADTSRVCGIDDSGRWMLLDQPDKVADY